MLRLFCREENKLNALRRAGFRGKSLVGLVGVALAALFLSLTFPAESGTNQANRTAVQRAVKLSAYEEAAIKRRAKARVKRLIRLAAERRKSASPPTERRNTSQ